MAAFIDKFQRFCGSRTLAWLIMANVTVFLISWAVILSGGMMGKSGNFTMSWLCVPSSPEAFIRHPWTAVTYMATHYDFLHLLFNMLWLYWFGVMLFPSVSGNRLLLLYAGGGLAGAALYVAASAILPRLRPGLPLRSLSLGARHNDDGGSHFARPQDKPLPVGKRQTEVDHDWMHSPDVSRAWGEIRGRRLPISGAWYSVLRSHS